MHQKIWVIEDIPEKKATATSIQQKTIPACDQKSSKEKNPVLAYSLSLMIWGCGQFYNRQSKLGLLFLLVMINFLAFSSMIAAYRDSIISYLDSMYVDRSGTLLICVVLYFSGLVIWLFNAFQAYFESLTIREKYRQGTKMALLPAVCSLLVPGWGQLLNGQIKKGLFFHVFAITGLTAFPLIFMILSVWETLEASRLRFIIEWIFSISIILAPFVLLIWICGIFDAAKVSMRKILKEPLLIRMNHAKNRFRQDMRMYGWRNAMLPHLKRTLLIVLLLIFCAINYHSIPGEFYLEQLRDLESRMTDEEMTVLPGIIKKLPFSASSGR